MSIWDENEIRIIDDGLNLSVNMIIRNSGMIELYDIMFRIYGMYIS